jgi:hypothetical protein
LPICGSPRPLLADPGTMALWGWHVSAFLLSSRLCLPGLCH